MNPGIRPTPLDVYAETPPPEGTEDFLLSVLEESKRLNYSLSGTGVSSIEQGFDLMVDLCLRLSSLLKEGSQLAERTNPEIGFSEWHQDALGNPKQFRVLASRKQYWNQGLGEELLDLAQRLIRVKNNRFEGSLYPPGISSPAELPVKSHKASSNRSQKRKERIRKRQIYYQLRHRRKAEGQHS